MEPVRRDEDRVSLDITPLAGNIGGVVERLRLSDDLDAATVSAIRAALIRHKVLGFRGQIHFTAELLQRFAGLLGDPYTHPTVKGSGKASVTELEAAEGYAASGWHTDVTFAASYPRFTILHGVSMPKAGGDTLFANTATAYQSLPAAFRHLVDGLWAFHDNRFDYSRSGEVRAMTRYQRAFFSKLLQCQHPLVHVHPDSGERHLIGGSYLKRIAGFDENDSNHLRAIVQDHITRPDNTVRWRWSDDDIVIWDNAATQHCAIADFSTQRRSLRRATAGGFTPVSIDGAPSQTVVQPDED